MATGTGPVRGRTPAPAGPPLRAAPRPPAPTPRPPSEAAATVPSVGERFTAELGTAARLSHVQALGAAAAATVVGLLLGLGAEPGVFVPFLVAVAAIAVRHGPGPAVTTTVASAVAVYVWFLAPLLHLAFDPSGLRRLAFFRIGVFVVAAAAVTWLADRQRRRVEEFERSRRQLRSFIASPEVGMQVVDHDGCVTWADDTMHRLLGRGDGEYVGSAFAAVHADPTVANDVVDRIRTGRRLENVRTTLRRKDGSTLEALLNANTLLGDARAPGTGVLLAVLPIAQPAPTTDVGKLLVACLTERRTRAAAVQKSGPRPSDTATGAPRPAR